MQALLRVALLTCVFCFCLCPALAAPRPHSSSSSSLSSSLSSSFSPLHSTNGFSTDPTTGMTTFTLGNTTTHNVEARQIAASTLFGILLDGVKLVDQLIKILNGDKNARGEYTKSLVTGVRAKYPYLNVVVVHGDHSFKWDGVEGRDWVHQHKEFDIKAGGTVGYEMYIARSGAFRNKGDGGYLNWAYGGDILTTTNGGADVLFGPYATPRGKLRTK